MEETATSLITPQPVTEPIPSAGSVSGTDAALDSKPSKNATESTKIEEAAASLTCQPPDTEPVSSADSVSNTDAQVGDNPSNDAAKTENPSKVAEAPDSVLPLKNPTHKIVFADPTKKSALKNVSSVEEFQYKFMDGTLMDHNQKRRFRELLEQKIHYLMKNRLLLPKDTHGVPSIQLKGATINTEDVGTQNSSTDVSDITSVGNGAADPASESSTTAAGSENTERNTDLEMKFQSNQELTGLGCAAKVEKTVDAQNPESHGSLEPLDLVEGEPLKESQEQSPKKSSFKSFSCHGNKDDAKTASERAFVDEIPESNGAVESRRRRQQHSKKALMTQTVQQTVSRLRMKFQQLSPSQQDAIKDVNGLLALVGIVDFEELPKQNKYGRTFCRDRSAAEAAENVEDCKLSKVKSGYEAVMEGANRVPWSQLPNTVGSMQLTRNDKNWLRRRLFFDAQDQARVKRRGEGTSLDPLKEGTAGGSRPSAENEEIIDWGEGVQTKERRRLIWEYYLKEAQSSLTGSGSRNYGQSSGGTARENVSTSSAAVPAAKKLKMSPAGELGELAPLMNKLVENVVRFSHQQQPIDEPMEDVVESTSVHRQTRTKAQRRRLRRGKRKMALLHKNKGDEKKGKTGEREDAPPLQRPSPDRPSYLSSRAGDDGCRIAIVPRGYPSVRITSGQAELIQFDLLEYMSDSVGPRFQDSYEERGALVFTCSDEYTVNWLYWAVMRIKPWPSAQLGAIPWTDRAEVSVQIPKLLENMSGRALLEKLKSQNPDVLGPGWEFRQFDRSRYGQTAIFSVTVEALEALRSAYCQLFLGFVKVNCEVLSEPL